MIEILNKIDSMSEDSQLTLVVLAGIACWALAFIVETICETIKSK